MFKLLKKIRQGLLIENKLNRYVLYAIGEIILVVIGILIALQINTWNELNKLQKQELLYLERLVIENKEDLFTFSNHIEELEKGNLTISEMSKALNSEEAPDSILVQTVKDFLIYGSQYPIFNPSSSTFDDLSSTGNLGVIQKNDLRDIIVKHYADYKFIQSTFQINTNWTYPIDASFFTNQNAMKFEPITAFLFKTEALSLSAQEIRSERENYIRNSAIHFWINDNAISLLQGIRDETMILVDRLEDEIENHKSR